MKMHDEIPVFGDMSFRGKCPVETAEQVTFFNVLRTKYPELASIAIHPRNEGKFTHAQVTRQKMEGMNPGASDIIIPAAFPFVCELKRRDHTASKWQPGQQEYLLSAKRHGCFICVALGWEAAMQAIEEWIAIAKTN